MTGNTQSSCARQARCVRLRYAAWAVLAAMVLPSRMALGAGDAPPLLTDPAAVWTMPLDQRTLVHRCRFEGRVNFVDNAWNNFWMEGPDGVRYIQLSGRDLPLRSGQSVVIEGTFVPARGLDGETVTVTVLDEEVEAIAIETSGRFGEVSAFSGRVVVTDAYVDDQQLIDHEHLRLYLIIEDRPVIAWVPPDDPGRVTDLRRKFIRIQAVYSDRLDPTGTESTVELWTAGEADIELLGSIEDAPQFRVPATDIAQINDVPRGTRALVQGRLQRRDPGNGIVVRDETGEITVGTLQRQRIPLGTPVEAVGTVQVDGARWVLESALFRVNPQAGGWSANGLAADRETPLSRVELVRRLGPEQSAAALGVDLVGSVVWSIPEAEFFYLHDMSGGVRVHRPAGIPEPPLQKSVRVIGRTRPGRAGAEVEAVEVIDVGAMAHPKPRLISVAQARTGTEDGQWVAMRGFLREIVSDRDWHWIHVTGAEGEFVGHLQSPLPFAATPGSMIRIQGICESVPAGDGRIVGTQLRVPFLHDIAIEEDAPDDLFDLPVQPLDGLRRLDVLRDLVRARVAGTVLHQVAGEGFVIESGTTAVRVFSSEAPLLVPGERVDVVGIVGRAGARVVLREAHVRSLGRGPVPVAVELPAPANLEPGMDERLVRIRASVADVVIQPDRARLTLHQGMRFFEALVEDQAGVKLGPHVEPGAVIDVSGLYRIEYSDAREPRGFHLQLRSAGDVAVVHAARFWTVQRLFTASGVLAGAFLLTGAAALLLRRRVAKQTVEITRQAERQGHLEAELERALRFKALGLLAGGLAHDFNNLLTSIMGNASVALFDREVAKRAGDCLRDIEDSAGRAHQLTQQLVTFAEGGDPLVEPADLSSLIHAVVRRVFAGDSSRARIELPPDLWPVKVDRAQMLRALENIVMRGKNGRGGAVLVNARNHAAAAGDVASLEPGRYVELEMRGCGESVPEDRLRIFFDPYASTSSDSDRFSMAIVYSILKRHGGLASIQSDPSDGAVFRLWIPAAEGLRSQPLAPAGNERVGSRTLLNVRVLLMDDEESIRRLGERCLRHLGCETQVAADGGECVRIYEAAVQAGCPFDVVILDLTVPGGLGGRETIVALKSIDPAVRAIVSSGYSNDPVMARYREHGFVAVVPKPYSIDALTTTLQRVLAESAG